MSISKTDKSDSSVQTSIVPWLSVRNSRAAVEFYKKAFGAVEVYHMDGEDDSIISRLSVDDAEFWVSEGDVDGKRSVRIILTYADPEFLFAKALQAGASEVYAVGEAHGWKLGRIEDPFGIHWEIGYQLAGE